MKIKINKIDKTYWYYPTLITTSRKFWHPRPYNNFKKLLKTENLLNQDFIISLNGDKELKTFRMIQTLKERKVFFNQDEIEKINQKEVVKEKIQKSAIYLTYDQKSLKAIKKGFIPFYQNNYFFRNFPKKSELIWRKNGWEEK